MPFDSFRLNLSKKRFFSNSFLFYHLKGVGSTGESTQYVLSPVLLTPYFCIVTKGNKDMKAEEKETMQEFRYYKVSLSSDRGRKIEKFILTAEAAIRAADSLAKELGAEARTESPGAVYPGLGIGSLIFRKPQHRKRYECIGKSENGIEYIPNAKEKKGIDVMKKIYDLPYVGSRDIKEAFGIDGNETKSPLWFIQEKDVFLRCEYSLCDDYLSIEKEEFETAFSQVKK